MKTDTPETECTCIGGYIIDGGMCSNCGRPRTECHPRTRLIAIRICEPCLKAEGQECHTPECALFLHKVDLPFTPELYEVLPDDFRLEQLTACRSALREARDYVIDYGNEKTMAPVIERIDAALDGQSVKEAQP